MTAERASWVWYVAYGSNMDLRRLQRYLDAGRDAAAPVESRGVVMPGVVYFATESPVWGGGRAFYDPAAEGRAYARAHLISAGQFSDIAAQEMNRRPGAEADIDLDEVVRRGRAQVGPGRYETLVRVGEAGRVPMVSFTAPWRVGEVELRRPSPSYLRHFVLGLRAVGGRSDLQIARYLAGCPGAAGAWTVPALLALMRAEPPDFHTFG
ncbi:histone deacetylase [Streptomyces sp. NPDC093111]|uniref:histone deacetylase n=1 Tax=Streptomyces sp. NPDC093111 TaxID=3154978 RepID=UPI00344128DE